MEKLIFRKYDGTLINDVTQYLIDWTKEHPKHDITIGCDSQEHGKYIKYAICIVMHMFDESGSGKGAHSICAVVYDKSKNIKTDLYNKLWAEAELVLQAAQMIEKSKCKVTVHLDFNSKETEYSNMLYNSGIGYLKAHGFDAVGKPFAYASTHVADKICKQ